MTLIIWVYFSLDCKGAMRLFWLPWLITNAKDQMEWNMTQFSCVFWKLLIPSTMIAQREHSVGLDTGETVLQGFQYFILSCIWKMVLGHYSGFCNTYIQAIAYSHEAYHGRSLRTLDEDANNMLMNYCMLSFSSNHLEPCLGPAIDWTMAHKLKSP